MENSIEVTPVDLAVYGGTLLFSSLNRYHGLWYNILYVDKFRKYYKIRYQSSEDDVCLRIISYHKLICTGITFNCYDRTQLCPVISVYQIIYFPITF